jgi:hypothetical protein
LSESALRRWVKQLEAERGGSTPSSKALTPEQQLIKELEARVKRLEQEKFILKKATVDSSDHRHEYNIMTMCRILQVARSGFYQWLQKPLSDRAVDNQRLLAQIIASYQGSSGVYGAPRVFMDL